MYLLWEFLSPRVDERRRWKPVLQHDMRDALLFPRPSSTKRWGSYILHLLWEVLSMWDVDLRWWEPVLWPSVPNSVPSLRPYLNGIFTCENGEGVILYRKIIKTLLRINRTTTPWTKLIFLHKASDNERQRK